MNALRALASELRVIRAAQRNGRKLGVHPHLLHNRVIDARVTYLTHILCPDAPAAADGSHEEVGE